MKKIVLVVWLLLPVVALAYHFGPGQNQVTLDRVDRLLTEADALAKAEMWDQAVVRYKEALQELPEERVAEVQRVRLEMSKAQMLSSQLPEAHQTLRSLVDTLREDEDSDPEMLAEAREAYANSQFYMTWLMRLEGRPDAEWRREIDSAEQTLRMLVEQSQEEGDSESEARHRLDLESTIKLARMDLGELQGLPLPSQ